MTVKDARMFLLVALLAWRPGSAVVQGGEPIYKISVRPSPRPVPAPVQYAAAAYDSKRDRLFTFGGADPNHKDTPVLRKLDLATSEWSIVETSGDAPRAAALPALVYDPKQDALFLFGGWAAGAQKPSGELWTFSLASSGSPPSWKQLADGPRARNGCVLALDAQRNRLLLFGGDGGPHTQYGFTPLNDLWAFDLAARTWTRLKPTGEVPAPRWNLSGAVDNQAGRLFTFGGAGYVNGATVRDSAVFELDLAKLVWTKHDGQGNRPTPVEGATLTWDLKNGVLLVAGGLSIADVGEPGSTSVWLYDPKSDQWGEETRALDRTRRGHVAIYDVRRDEHLVVGGETAEERGNFYAHGEVLLDALKLSVVRR